MDIAVNMHRELTVMEQIGTFALNFMLFNPYTDIFMMVNEHSKFTIEN